MEIVTGDVRIAGKTKTVYSVNGQPNLAVLENKVSITAHDDPAFTKQFASKAVSATTTTCRIFECLQRAGIPVAYHQQLSPTTFLAEACRMLPLEVVGRRYLVGSYCQRFPGTLSTPPQRVEDKVLVEFFLKTTQGKIALIDSRIRDLGLRADRGEEDPLIANVHSNSWLLMHAKKPATDDQAYLGEIAAGIVIKDHQRLAREMIEILTRLFLVLEELWWRLGEYYLIDIKVEFGLTSDGRLVVADVIDNDSWRLRDSLWQELSKQLFRDGHSLEVVEVAYRLVAELARQLAALPPK